MLIVVSYVPGRTAAEPASLPSETPHRNLAEYSTKRIWVWANADADPSTRATATSTLLPPVIVTSLRLINVDLFRSEAGPRCVTGSCCDMAACCFQQSPGHGLPSKYVRWPMPLFRLVTLSLQAVLPAQIAASDRVVLSPAFTISATPTRPLLEQGGSTAVTLTV